MNFFRDYTWNVSQLRWKFPDLFCYFFRGYNGKTRYFALTVESTVVFVPFLHSPNIFKLVNAVNSRWVFYSSVLQEIKSFSISPWPFIKYYAFLICREKPFREECSCNHNSARMANSIFFM